MGSELITGVVPYTDRKTAAQVSLNKSIDHVGIICLRLVDFGCSVICMFLFSRNLHSAITSVFLVDSHLSCYASKDLKGVSIQDI